jgi:hypothetical protein
MSELVGTWKYVDSSDNFDEFFKEIGLNKLSRKLAVKQINWQKGKTKTTMANNGKKWKITSISALTSKNIEFNEKEEFIESKTSFKILKFCCSVKIICNTF